MLRGSLGASWSARGVVLGAFWDGLGEDLCNFFAFLKLVCDPPASWDGRRFRGRFLNSIFMFSVSSRFGNHFVCFLGVFSNVVSKTVFRSTSDRFKKDLDRCFG